MAFVVRAEGGDELNEPALVVRLRQFVENSDHSFYRIASGVGTSGAILSMWLAGTAKPGDKELAEIERFLGSDHPPQR
jgi:DNA transposition AAA+ family ATPase